MLLGRGGGSSEDADRLVISAWNLIGSLALPSAWYVQANLVVATAAVITARCAGFGWDELGLDRPGDTDLAWTLLSGAS